MTITEAASKEDSCFSQESVHTISIIDRSKSDCPAVPGLCLQSSHPGRETTLLRTDSEDHVKSNHSTWTSSSTSGSNDNCSSRRLVTDNNKLCVTNNDSSLKTSSGGSGTTKSESAKGCDKLDTSSSRGSAKTTQPGPSTAPSQQTPLAPSPPSSLTTKTSPTGSPCRQATEEILLCHSQEDQSDHQSSIQEQTRCKWTSPKTNRKIKDKQEQPQEEKSLQLSHQDKPKEQLEDIFQEMWDTHTSLDQLDLDFLEEEPLDRREYLRAKCRHLANRHRNNLLPREVYLQRLQLHKGMISSTNGRRLKQRKRNLRLAAQNLSKPWFQENINHWRAPKQEEEDNPLLNQPIKEATLDIPDPKEDPDPPAPHQGPISREHLDLINNRLLQLQVQDQAKQLPKHPKPSGTRRRSGAPLRKCPKLDSNP